jgi:hypothetical protein
MTAEAAQIKGTMFLHARAFTVEKAGEAAWTELVAALPAADRRVLDGLVLATGWYPIGIWNRMLARYRTIHGAHFVDELARYVSDRDMNLLFTLLLRMGSPEFVLKRAGSLWSRYFSAGKLEATPVATQRWRITLRAPTGADDGPGELVCGHGVPMWTLQALRLTGAKKARVVEVECRFRSAERCEYDVTW